MNALLLGEKTLTGEAFKRLQSSFSNHSLQSGRTGVICYKNNHKPAIEALASGKIDLSGQF